MGNAAVQRKTIYQNEEKYKRSQNTVSTTYLECNVDCKHNDCIKCCFHISHVANLFSIEDILSDMSSQSI